MKGPAVEGPLRGQGSPPVSLHQEGARSLRRGRVLSSQCRPPLGAKEDALLLSLPSPPGSLPASVG